MQLIYFSYFLAETTVFRNPKQISQFKASVIPWLFTILELDILTFQNSDIRKFKDYGFENFTIKLISNSIAKSEIEVENLTEFRISLKERKKVAEIFNLFFIA